MHKHKQQQKPELFFIYGTAARDHIKGKALEDKLLAYSQELEEETRRQGARLLSHSPARGYWQGKPEPSFKSVILATRAAAFAIAHKLRESYEQEAILLVEPNPSAGDTLLSVQIPSHKSEEEVTAVIDLKAYTITGGAVEIIGEEPAKAEAIAKAINKAEPKKISARSYLVTEKSERQKRKQERKERAREILSGETREERREREEREQEERREEEAREARAKAREAERRKRRAERERKRREALQGIGYQEEEREIFKGELSSTLKDIKPGEAREIVKGINIVRF